MLIFLKKGKWAGRGNCVSICVCNGIYERKKTLKTLIFLVNIELGSAPKKMLIFLPFFQKGKGGEGGKRGVEGGGEWGGGGQCL